MYVPSVQLATGHHTPPFHFAILSAVHCPQPPIISFIQLLQATVPEPVRHSYEKHAGVTDLTRVLASPGHGEGHSVGTGLLSAGNMHKTTCKRSHMHGVRGMRKKAAHPAPAAWPARACVPASVRPPAAARPPPCRRPPARPGCPCAGTPPRRRLVQGNRTEPQPDHPCCSQPLHARHSRAYPSTLAAAQSPSDPAMPPA